MFPHFVHYFSEGRESFYSNIRLYALTNTWTQQDRNDSVVTIWKNSSNIGEVGWYFVQKSGSAVNRRLAGSDVLSTSSQGNENTMVDIFVHYTKSLLQISFSNNHKRFTGMCSKAVPIPILYRCRYQ